MLFVQETMGMEIRERLWGVLMYGIRIVGCPTVLGGDLTQAVSVGE